MVTLSNIIKRLSESRTERAQRLRESHRRQLGRELAETVQLREWQGKMYIAIEGVPMVSAELLNGGIIEALERIREEVINYKTN